MEKDEKSVSTEGSEASEIDLKEVSEVDSTLNATPIMGSTELSDIISESEPPDAAKAKRGRTRKRGRKWVVKEDYIDIIKDQFWESKPWLLG